MILICQLITIKVEAIMDYWEKCVRQAFDDADIFDTSVSEEQLLIVIDYIKYAHESYDMISNEDIIAQANHLLLNHSAR